MNDKLNASGAILPGALRLGHVLPPHHGSTAVPMKMLEPFFTTIVLCLFRASGVFDRVTMSTPFLMRTSILAASETHRDGDGLRQTPVMTGVLTLTVSQ
jgi:hypothetical protein